MLETTSNILHWIRVLATSTTVNLGDCTLMIESCTKQNKDINVFVSTKINVV